MKKRIVFRLIDKNTSGYKLPRSLTQQRIPNDVVYKLDKLIRQFMKVVVKAAVTAIKAAVAAAQELVAAVAACGGAVIAVVLVLCLVAALLMSPMGVFLSGEENGGGTMASVVRKINQEYDKKSRNSRQVLPAMKWS